MAATNPKFEEAILEKEEELKNHKAYVYQFLVNIGENKDNFNVILRFSDRGVEETIHEQLEPIIQRLKQKNSINVNVLKSDIGEVTINDMQEAATCGAEIFTFGTELNHEAGMSQAEFGVVPKVHKLIHCYLKDFEEAAINRKKFTIKGTEKGRGVIAQVYKIKAKKVGEESVSVPGVRMMSGKLSKSNKIYIFRNGSPISDSLFAKSIKVFKKEVGEIKKGDECTVTLDVKADFQYEKGDELVAYE